jgi:hypothetical protein
VTIERLRRNGMIIIFIRREAMVVKILRILDPINIDNILALHRSARCGGSDRRRFFWNLDKFTLSKLAPFWLGWIVVGYVEDLSKKMLCQSTILNKRIYQASKEFDQRAEDARCGGVIY